MIESRSYEQKKMVNNSEENKIKTYFIFNIDVEIIN